MDAEHLKKHKYALSVVQNLRLLGPRNYIFVSGQDLVSLAKMPSNKDFLDLLLQRQAMPMNKPEDKPQWLEEGEEHGQDHVFTSAVLESVAASIASPSDNPKAPAAASEKFDTANWNWRLNPRGDEDSKARDAAKLASDRVAALSEADTLLLINTFIASQAERVKTYTDYQATFDLLLKNARLVDYPMLVAEITARFAAISQHIIAVAQALQRRAETGDAVARVVARCIQRVQAQEQEKLTVVAAGECASCCCMRYFRHAHTHIMFYILHFLHVQHIPRSPR